jgi:hypothetical protein
MTQKNAGLFRNAILDQIHPIIPLVNHPALTDAGTVDPFDMSDYTARRDARDKKLAQIDEQNMTLYSAVWRQCTLTMHARLKEDKVNYGTYSSISDGISLLKAIKSASQNYVSTTYRIGKKQKNFDCKTKEIKNNTSYNDICKYRINNVFQHQLFR